MAINENTLAKEVAAAESGKISQSIAQIKEVIRLTLILLSREKPSDVLAMLEKRSDQILPSEQLREVSASS